MPKHSNFFEYKGEEKCLAHWCRDLGLNYNIMYNRCVILGIPFEEAMNTPRYTRMRKTGRKPMRKPHRKKTMVDDNTIQVDGVLIKGNYVKYTARGLFRADDGVIYIRDEFNHFSIYEPLKKSEMKPNLFLCDIKNEAQNMKASSITSVSTKNFRHMF